MLRVQCWMYDMVCQTGVVYKQNGNTITCPQVHGRTQWATSYQVASTEHNRYALKALTCPQLWNTSSSAAKGFQPHG